MVDPLDRRELRAAFRARIQREIAQVLGVPPDLPEGTLTVMFTDVEGSSALVRDLGDQRARALLRAHDAVVRDALQAHGGTEVEHPGDSFMVAFRTARAALTCAVDIHRRLAAERALNPEMPHVRIGMDVGEVISEDAGYFGATVFRASRIAQIARGGETLVSQTVRLLVRDAPFDLVDVGDHELKGLGGPDPLFAVGTPGGPAAGAAEG